jgi:hypothetical protein
LSPRKPKLLPDHGREKRARAPMRMSDDLLSGLLFVAAGVAAVIAAQGYGFGDMLHMGAGFFPGLIGAGLAILGAVIAGRAFYESEITFAQWTEWRSLIFITAAVIVFALLIKPAGLIISIAALVAVAWFADPKRRLYELPLMILLLEAICLGTFIYALGMPIKLGPF